MGDINKTGVFTLPEKKVRVEYIMNKRGMASGEHINKGHLIEGGLLDTAVLSYPVPLNRTGKGLVNVLTGDEKVFLERELGTKLSVYSDYWEDANVYLNKQGITLDLSTADGYIQMAILRANKEEICFGLENVKNKLTYRFVVVEEGEKVIESKKLLDYKKDAWKAYGKYEDEKEILIGILKLLDNKPVSPNSKIGWVQAKVEDRVDKTPRDFLRIVNDSSFETKLLINKAIEKDVLIRNGRNYKSVDGLELCEPGAIPNFENAVRYLDNVKNQDIRSLIEARMSGELGTIDSRKKPTKKSK